MPSFSSGYVSSQLDPNRIGVAENTTMGFLSWLRELLHRNTRNKSVPGVVKARGELAYSYIQQGNYVAARELVSKALDQRD